MSWINNYTDGKIDIISIQLDDIFPVKEYLDDFGILIEKIYITVVRFNKFLTNRLKNRNIEDFNCTSLDYTLLDEYELINFFIDNKLTEYIDVDNIAMMAKYKKIYELYKNIENQSKYIIYTNGYNIFYGIQINLEEKKLDIFCITDNFAYPKFAVCKYPIYKEALKDCAKILFSGYNAIHTSNRIIIYEINPFEEKSIDYEGNIEK